VGSCVGRGAEAGRRVGLSRRGRGRGWYAGREAEEARGGERGGQEEDVGGGEREGGAAGETWKGGHRKADRLPHLPWGRRCPRVSPGSCGQNAVRSHTAAPGLFILAAAVAGVRGIICGEGITAPTSMSGSDPSSHRGPASPGASGVVEGQAFGAAHTESGQYSRVQ